MKAPELKLMRQALFLTQPELADVLGIKTARMVRYWEAGTYHFPDHHADRVREIDRGCDEAAYMTMEDFAASADKTLTLWVAETEEDVVNNWINLVAEARTQHPKIAQACALRVTRLMRHMIAEGRAKVELVYCTKRPASVS